MRNNVVLIDFESVQPKSIEALMDDHIFVLIFLGANQKKLPVEIVKAIQKMGSRASYIEISGTGHNALDFHIAYYMGKLSNGDSTPYFHIISKDKGYDPLIQHLHTQNIFSARSETIEDIPFVKNGRKTSFSDRAEIFVAKLSEPKMSRPSSEITLARAIKAYFRDAVEESDLPAIITAIQKTGFLKIHNKKVIYRQPSEKQCSPVDKSLPESRVGLLVH